MPVRKTIQTAVITLVIAWTIGVMAEHALVTGRWLATLGQAVVLFAVTAALAWAGATTDNLMDEVLGRGGRGEGKDQPGGPRTWRVHVPAEVEPTRRRGRRRR